MRELFAVLKKHPWISGLIIFLALFIPLLPVALQQTAVYVLEKQTGQKASIEDVDLNLFKGKLAVYNIKLQNETQLTQIKSFKADIRLRKLFEKRLQFANIELNGSQLPVEIIQKDEKQTFRIAGIELPQKQKEESETSAPFIIDTGVDQLTINDFKLHFIQQDREQLYQVRSLTLDELYSWDKDFARLKLNSALNQHRINANLQLHLFSDIPKLVGTLKVDKLNLADIQSWLPVPTSGQMDGDLTFTLEQHPNGLVLYQYSEINLHNADIQLPEQEIAGDSLEWKGDIHYFHGEVQGVKVDGKLNGQMLKFAQKSPNGNIDLNSNLSADIHLTGLLSHNAKIQQNGLLKLTDLNVKQNSKTEQGSSTTTVKYPQLSFNGKLEWLFKTPTLKLDGQLNGKDLDLSLQSQGPEKHSQTLALSLPALDFKGINQLELADTLQLTTQGRLNLGTLNLQQTEFNASREKLNELKLSNRLQARLNLTGEIAEKSTRFNQTGSINISQLSVEQGTNRVATPAINWNGKIAFSDKNSQQSLDLNGDLLSEKLQLNTESMQLSNKLDASIKLALNSSQKTLTLQQQGAIKLADLLLEQPELTQKLKTASYQGNISYQLDKTDNTETPESLPKQSVNLAGKLKLDQSQTQIKQENIELTHSLDSDFQLSLQMDNDQTTLNYQGSGVLNALNFASKTQKAKVEQLDWQGTTRFSQAVNKEAVLGGKLKLKAKEISLGTPKQMPGKPAVIVKSATLTQLNLASLERFSLRSLNITGLQLQGYQKAQKVPFNRSSRLTLDRADIQTAPQIEARLGNIVINNSQTQITLDKEHQLIQLAALRSALGIESPKAEQQTPDNQEKTASQSAQTPQFSMASLQLSGQNDINIELQSSKQPVRKQVKLDLLEIGAFDSRKSQDSSNFKLIAIIDEFSKIQSSGKISPSLSPLNLDAKTQIDGLSLNDFSPIVEDAVGYKIDSGQLSATINSLIKNNKLNIDNSIKLYKLQLSSADQAKTEEFNKNFNVPLEVGLDLLQDKSGNIKLDLPIDGDLDNPNFSVGSIVAKAMNGALGKATRTYLLLALQPFGAIALVGEMALDQLSAVRLQPVTFLDTRASLTEEMQQYLQKVAKLLKSRSNVQIKLCGGVNQQDRLALIEMARARMTERQKEQNKEIKIYNDQLLALAKLRQSVIKRYLLKQGVNTNQIVLCQPEISEKNETPKVDLGI